MLNLEIARCEAMHVRYDPAGSAKWTHCVITPYGGVVGVATTEAGAERCARALRTAYEAYGAIIDRDAADDRERYLSWVLYAYERRYECVTRPFSDASEEEREIAKEQRDAARRAYLAAYTLAVDGVGFLSAVGGSQNIYGDIRATDDGAVVATR